MGWQICGIGMIGMALGTTIAEYYLSVGWRGSLILGLVGICMLLAGEYD